MAGRNPNPEMPAATTTVKFQPYDDGDKPKRHVTIKYAEVVNENTDSLAGGALLNNLYIPLSAAALQLGGKVPDELEVTLRVVSYRPNNKLTV